MSGPIAFVGCQLDYRAVAAGHLNAARFLVAQGAQRYVARSSVAWWLTTSSVWESMGPFSAAETDFVEQLPNGSYDLNSHPDFSVAGAPLAFGFSTHSDTSSTGTVTVDYDNFSVAVNGVPAAMSVRVGSPPNADVFRPLSGAGPVIGTTWDLVVDHQSFLPAATIDVVGLSTMSTNLPTPFGTFLCDSLQVTVAGPAGQPFAVAVPNDLTLVGQAYCLQAASFDPATGMVRLTNALDVMVGTL
jgi:hypothetical protein